jgi:hypothetical protein
VSDMHMNLWSYNKRKVGDTIFTPPPPPPPLLEIGTVSKFKRKGGKSSECLQRGSE